MYKNKKDQHAIGVAKAIAHFTEGGNAVLVPVSDHQHYDLVVDMHGTLQKLEVKTTSSKTGDIELRTKGGNQSWSGETKRISADDCDILFCMNVNTGACDVFTAPELERRAAVRVK